MEQWGDVDLGDSRRTNRALEAGAALAQNPSANLPTQMESWNQLKAAYRLLREKDVTYKAPSSTPLFKHSLSSSTKWRTNRTLHPRHNGTRL
ncbi:MULTISPECIES: IS4/Tn5 family transposase DNA-binding protein [unclassified Microcoleus]|uniref:IS4/Tn5 family transposase DNA-binding protein n=1 Tax=unclassified Microcoleus TaxID=2642155 RepID=UPI00403F1883